ncbi:hypothetical protein [Moorena sp. SIO4G3]|uniref:hypothetical protein n=1 Tax=Moorena sp. SIO4G3 TaxID=2607821 RepID=UPI00142A1F4D|nr:hypothetical protein [Moorena sp. SIO4G3]NEO80643.1 hypothetical protein [Moorena sp. SIO4G3]
MGETTPVAHGGNPQDRTGSPRPRCIAFIPIVIAQGFLTMIFSKISFSLSRQKPHVRTCMSAWDEWRRLNFVFFIFIYNEHSREDKLRANRHLRA